jgi:hypothetical protein
VRRRGQILARRDTMGITRRDPSVLVPPARECVRSMRMVPAWKSTSLQPRIGKIDERLVWPAYQRFLWQFD